MDFKQLYDSLTVQNEQIQNLRFSQRVPDTKPTLTLEQYAGTYIDPYYGKIEIVLENGQLVIRWSSQLHMTLEHWHYDTFKGTHNKSWIRPDLVTFELNESGKVAKILSGSLTFIKK
jgi:hypothetical protein